MISQGAIFPKQSSSTPLLLIEATNLQKESFIALVNAFQIAGHLAACQDCIWQNCNHLPKIFMPALDVATAKINPFIPFLPMSLKATLSNPPQLDTLDLVHSCSYSDLPDALQTYTYPQNRALLSISSFEADVFLPSNIILENITCIFQFVKG